MKFLSRCLLILTAFVFSAVAPAMASNVTGTFVTPNTSIPLRNATVTFTLNQAAVSPSSFLIVPTPVSCYTSVDGSIKGLPNPLATPVVSNNLISGSINAGTYYVRITYTASGVETLPSPAFATVLSGTGQILVTAPVFQPALATGYNVYIGTVSGSETLQATITGFTTATITSYSVTTSAPSSNNSVCALTFNDATIPAPTTYRVNVVDVNGNNVPGFPQQWYLAGSSFNVSNGYPVAVNVQTRFPQPIIANPSSSATQSVNSPITLNGFQATMGIAVFSGAATPGVSTSGSAKVWYDSNLNQLLASVNGAAAVNLLTLAPSLPLTQSQGGTNRSSPISAGELVYSDGTTYQGTTGLVWNNSTAMLTVTGRYIVKATSQVNPASDSGSVQLFYDSGADQATIYAASNDGSGGGTGKQLNALGSVFVVKIGTPSSQTTALTVDANKSTNVSFRLQEHMGVAVASANNLSLGADGTSFSITGTTQINLIDSTNWQAGSVVRLEFASNPTVKQNQSASGAFKPILLSGSADLTTLTANSVLSLMYDGSNWVEIAKSIK